jgi:hypothetical protein
MTKGTMTKRTMNKRTMNKTWARSKLERHRQAAWMHDRRAGIDKAVPRSDQGRQINDLGEVRIRFRFVLIQKLTHTKSCGRFHYWLWMESGWRCADSANHITSSRQALIPTRGIIGRVTATARTRALVGVPRAYRLSEF